MLLPVTKLPEVNVNVPFTVIEEVPLTVRLLELLTVRLLIPVAALISVPKAEPIFDAIVPSALVKL